MTATAPPSPFALLANLPASGPHPAYKEPLMLFGQFVGIWDMDVAFFEESGRPIFRGPGEWSFAWVLDGRALQDVLTYAAITNPAAQEPGERRTGTSLRHYNPSSQRWQVIWLGATSGTLLFLEGGRVGDEIWLEGPEGDSARLRWMFTAITAEQFEWRGLISTDGGASWRMEQAMSARRRTAGAALMYSSPPPPPSS